MTEATIWLILRWVAIITLGIFLAWLITKVLRLFLSAMGDDEPEQSQPPISGQMPGSPSERYLSRPGVWIETNWGGMGGGLSGWRVSNAIIYLLVLTLLLGCLSLAVVSLPGPPEKSAAANKPQGGPGQPPPSTSEGQKTDKKDTDKKDADQKAGETKTSGPSAGDKDQKKSSDSPAAGKKAEQ